MERTADAGPRPPLKARVDSRTAGAKARGSGEAPAPGEEALEALSTLAQDLRVLARIRLEAVRERALEMGATAQRELWVAIVGLAATATAVVLLVRGVSDGLTGLLSGRAWVADVLTGAVVLGIVVIVQIARETFRRRRRLRRLRRDLEPRS